MLNTRASGILMHITSMPSPFGVGVFGDEVLSFCQRLKRMGFSYLQILPLNPVDMCNSPYKSEAAFAIWNGFLDPRKLFEKGLISKDLLDESFYNGSPYSAAYDFASDNRQKCIKVAFKNADKTLLSDAKKFLSSNDWLFKYALFKALKLKFNGKPWYEWEKEYSVFETAKNHINEVESDFDFFVFEQYLLNCQWTNLKNSLNDSGVKVLGDMPIYVDKDSCDVWANRELFQLDEKNFECKRVAGVPPDYFSADGQLWGNPLYDWQALKKDNFNFWIERIKRSFELFDTVRIDHFRAFSSYWSVPFGAKTAKEGHWEKALGSELFKEVKKRLGEKNIIAEDLGIISEDVYDLLEETGFPGMRIIEFGFDPSGDSTHLPHNYPKNCVAYLGTHDNDTLLTYLYDASSSEREFALAYCGFSGGDWGQGGFKSPAVRQIIETLWRSSAKLAIISFQDLCGFGSDTRMNTPGVPTGNWLFRTTEELISQIDFDYYRSINSLFRRSR